MSIHRDEGVEKPQGRKSSQHAACHRDGDGRGARATRAGQWRCGSPCNYSARPRALSPASFIHRHTKYLLSVYYMLRMCHVLGTQG